tara:strand:- start:499 stop:1050 length:552 start_codon:yes stop_codon:yes gene_type:complete
MKITLKQLRHLIKESFGIKPGKSLPRKVRGAPNDSFMHRPKLRDYKERLAANSAIDAMTQDLRMTASDAINDTVQNRDIAQAANDIMHKEVYYRLREMGSDIFKSKTTVESDEVDILRKIYWDRLAATGRLSREEYASPEDEQEFILSYEREKRNLAKIRSQYRKQGFRAEDLTDLHLPRKKI